MAEVPESEARHEPEKDEAVEAILEKARRAEAARWFQLGTADPQRCPQFVADYITVLCSRFDVRTVILFGSRARGTHDEFSDWDLFVVADDLPADWSERTKAMRRRRPTGVDVFAWTSQEVRQFIYRTFIQTIATEGVPLYGDMTWMHDLVKDYRTRRAVSDPERMQAGIIRSD